LSLPLQFGIPSFDALFGRPVTAEDSTSRDYSEFGIRLSPEHPTTSLCIIGPDGTGKSVFGLHLAAQYMADADLSAMFTEGGAKKPWCPRVLYVSTDLKHPVAALMWDNFGLHRPNCREFPFNWGYRLGRPHADRQVELTRLDPGAMESAVLAALPDTGKPRVHFVDLVSRTMGDDWSFISRLLAVLKTPGNGCAPHLLIIDAVEGFETLVGEKDAFGETTSRRARIAQIMRTGADKCHVCFIVEEPRAEERFPEEFVADVVVRLRTVTVRNYARRTVEIIKTRGQSHVRGQHPFVIRGTEGSTTGLQQNADDPVTANGYVHVFPSLHHLSREEMKARGPANPEPDLTHVAAFGITYLDEMLARLTTEGPTGSDDQGLRTQTTTALIGEIATQKTSLATAFLARTFRAFIFELADVIRELRGGGEFPKVRAALAARLGAKKLILTGQNPASDTAADVELIAKALEAKDITDLTQRLNDAGLDPPAAIKLSGAGVVPFASWLAAALSETGAAVLITTSDQDRDRLIKDFDRWLKNSIFKALQYGRGKTDICLTDKIYGKAFRTAVDTHLRDRTVCRRLELHDLSSAILIQIVQRAVQRAQEEVFLSTCLPRHVDRLPYHRTVRFPRSWNIRLVLDDLSTLKGTYPEIGSDPIFLPFLLSFLELEGVTSLIIDSQAGRPDAVVRDAFDRELRALVPHKLLTWRVPFFGSIRDAITVVPPYPSGLHSVIREVRWESKEDAPNALVVDPELELYSGLEKGEPKPIPLEVLLYAETGPMSDYITEENRIFGQLFTPIGPESGGKVIIGVEAGQYNALRDFCNLQPDTLLNHTMVFQVDEFWATDRSPVGEITRLARGPISRREGALYPLGPYLTEETCMPAEPRRPVPDRIADPFGVFYGEPAVVKKEAGRQSGSPWQRRHYFARSSQGISSDLDKATVARIDRVPFSWDFGFLLCPESMWGLASGRSIGYKKLTVGNVWAHMPNVIRNVEQQHIPWRTFLGACNTVAQVQAERTSVPVSALDVSTLAPESFVCLVLEIWASEILDRLPAREVGGFVDSLSHIDWGSPGSQNIHQWLENWDHLLDFYKTWLLLVESLPISSLLELETIPRLKGRDASGTAAATRHWYKTACKSQRCPGTGELAIPVRLPGHFSIRGDWYLAIAGGSRSERLGRRALDLFSTRRANFRRMELGIGLPTRDISSIGHFDQLPTALGKQDKTGHVTAVSYGDLIGASVHKEGHFHWFWRSQLRDYHRQNHLLHSWMGQLLSLWNDLRNQIGPEWRSGFELYDELEGLTYKGARTRLDRLQSWGMFKDACSLLQEQLVIASRSARSDSDRS
jgi:KaiC/GvpD/RAD55 family RecA-like ATPase